MLKSFLTFWAKSILRNPLFSSIKLLGFALGIACTLLLIVFSANELTYDRFHENHKSLYRIIIKTESREGVTLSAVNTAAIAESLEREIPEIKSTVRFAFPFEGFLKWNETSLKSTNLFYADSSLFSTMSFNLKLGNPKLALAEPYTMVLSESLAKNLFGNQNPVGETVVLDEEKQFKVTGIIEDAPSNSQIRYQALLSFNSLLDQRLFLDWDGGWNYLSYMMLHPKANPNDVIKKSIPIFDREINDRLREIGIYYSMLLEPITKSHLFSEAEFDLPSKGSLDQIIILSVAGLFVLIMSCVNFISLSAVQATSRLKEIGIKKVIGIPNRRLFITFMLETVLLTLLALVLASIVLLLLEPGIQVYLGFGIIELLKSNAYILAIIISLVVIIGFISGFYPAFILSRFKIADAVKGKFAKPGGLPVGIKVLILFQFTITIILFILTLVVYEQRDFILNKDLGFRKENIVVLPLPNLETKDKMETLKNELSGIASVVNICASSEIPGNGFTSNGYFPEGHSEPMMFNVVDIDAKFLETLDVGIIKGRNFMANNIADREAYMVNESLAQKLGWDNPIGKTITRNGDHQVIGVVKDFHFSTLHHPVEPLIITMKPWRGYNYLLIQITGDRYPESVAQMANAWNKINPQETFDYFFLDQTFESYYDSERRLGEVFLFFSIIAIVLCGSGLYATVSYSLKNRIKEIGIRKILGAGTLSLGFRLGGMQLIWILAANVIAIPAAMYLAELWLSRFQFTAGIGLPLWLGGVIFSFSIGILISGAQTVKAVRSNPVDILRQE
jgi:putative ABC transport system permease protein